MILESVYNKKSETETDDNGITDKIQDNALDRGVVPSYKGFIDWIKNLNNLSRSKKTVLIRKVMALKDYYVLHRSSADNNPFEIKSSTDIKKLLNEIKATPIICVKDLQLHGRLLPVTEYYLRYVLECEAASSSESVSLNSLEAQKMETQSFVPTEFSPEIVSASDNKPKRPIDAGTDPIALEQNNRMESALEEFTQWMQAKGTFSNGVINGYCSSIRLAEFYLQEQKPMRWSLFPADLKEAKQAITTLYNDEVFRRRDTKFSGKYNTALTYYHNYIDDQLSEQREITPRDTTPAVIQSHEPKAQDHLSEPEIHEAVKESPETPVNGVKPLVSDVKTYEIKTKQGSYRGNSVAEAFAAFCDYLVACYPLSMRSASGTPYNGQGSVVLKKTPSSDADVKLKGLNVYISSSLTDLAAMNYGCWLCRLCNDRDYPESISVSTVTDSVESGMTRLNNSIIQYEVVPQSGPVVGSAKAEKESDKDLPSAHESLQYDPTDALIVSEIEKADIDGITEADLSDLTGCTMAQIRTVAKTDKNIVILNDRLYHVDALVDWEEAADQLAEIMEKLMERNDGYVSASQLYDYARLDLQMFLNDNAMNDSRKVYDFAEYLFRKLKFKGCSYSFSGKTHISREKESVSTMLDLIQNYARKNDGYIVEDELVAFLKKMGLKTGNLRGVMQVYTKPIFLLYNGNEFILTESMNIDAQWLSVMNNALDKLFADLGDHVILRDIHPAWFQLLPELPGGRNWTIVLLQNVIHFFEKQLHGVRTIYALQNQSIDTVQAMIVSGTSEFRTFADAVAAYLVDDHVEKRRFSADELRTLLVQRGMIQGNELITNMPKALAGDPRFAWDASGEYVTVNI